MHLSEGMQNLVFSFIWQPVLFLYFGSMNKISMYRLVRKQRLTKPSIYIGFQNYINLC